MKRLPTEWSKQFVHHPVCMNVLLSGVIGTQEGQSAMAGRHSRQPVSTGRERHLTRCKEGLEEGLDNAQVPKMEAASSMTVCKPQITAACVLAQHHQLLPRAAPCAATRSPMASPDLGNRSLTRIFLCSAFPATVALPLRDADKKLFPDGGDDGRGRRRRRAREAAAKRRRRRGLSGTPKPGKRARHIVDHLQPADLAHVQVCGGNLKP